VLNFLSFGSVNFLLSAENQNPPAAQLHTLFQTQSTFLGHCIFTVCVWRQTHQFNSNT